MNPFPRGEDLASAPAPSTARLAAMVAIVAAAVSPVSAQGFRKTTVHSLYMGEGVDVGDFNKDGSLDVVNGPYWHQGPDFKTRHLYASVAPSGRDVSLGWELGAAAWWYENPKGNGGIWQRYDTRSALGHETRHIVDIQGDVRPEFIGANGGDLGWFEPDWASPRSPWKFHLMGRGDFGFGHGLGIGDVNGDGRRDGLCAHRPFEPMIPRGGRAKKIPSAFRLGDFSVR